MSRVHTVGERVAELVELRRIAVSVQEQDVIRIDGADRGLEATIEGPDGRALRVTRFVDRVVSGHPRVASVVRGDVFPEVDDAILELPLRPEVRPLRRVIAVPVLVLRAGDRVQVEDRVDAVPRAYVHDGVQKSEALLADLERCIIALEVAVVERDPHGVQAEALQERRIAIGEEHREEPVEEACVPLVAEDAAQRPTHLRLGSGVPGDEVLHVHPAAEAEAAQHDRIRTVQDAGTVHLQQMGHAHP